MLAQLVCLDRRYQRMNCFNMRELQALLKEKYFNDLVNNYDYRSNIFNSINLKYKLNDLSVIDNNLSLFNNNGLYLTFFTKIQNFNKSANETSLAFTNLNYFVLVNYNTLLNSKSILASFNLTAYYVKNSIEILLNNTCGVVLDVFNSLFFNTHYFVTNILSNTKAFFISLASTNQVIFNFYYQSVLSDLFLNNKIFTTIKYFLTTKTLVPGANFSHTDTSNTLISKSENKAQLTESVYFNNSIGESIENGKALRFNNPIFKYDYKLGNYLSKETINNFPHLMLSQTQVTGGIRKSAYIYSPHFIELFKNNINNYLSLFTITTTIPAFIEPELRHASSTSGFYNLFLNYYTHPTFINTH